MRYFPLIALFLIRNLVVPAQQSKIDSLQNLLLNVKGDTDEVNIQNELAKDLIKIKKYESAYIYSANALSLAYKISFKKGIAVSRSNMGSVKENQGKYSEALRNYREALDIMHETGDLEGMSQCYNHIGIGYMHQMNHPAALKNFFSSLKIKQDQLSELMGDKEGNKELIKEKQTSIASVYNNIGNSHKDMGNYAEALRHYLIALKIAEEIDSKYGIALLNNNIGIIYKEQHNYDEALKYYFSAQKIKEDLGQTKDAHYANIITNIGNIHLDQKNHTEALKNFLAALEIREATGDTKGIADAYHNMGNIFAQQGLYSEAVEKLYAALKIRLEIEDPQGIVASYIDIGNIYARLDKNEKALEYLNKGLKYALAIRHLEWTKNAYLGLANLDSAEALSFSKKGKWKEASEYYAKAFNNYRNHIVYKDSLVNEENTKNMVKVQMAYEFEKIDAAMKEEQSKKEAIVKLELEKRDQQRNYLIGGFVLMVLLMVFILRSYNQKQKANKIIVEQKKLVDSKQKDILDSLYYARKIQQALLPGDKYFGRTLGRLKKGEKDKEKVGEG